MKKRRNNGSQKNSCRNVLFEKKITKKKVHKSTCKGSAFSAKQTRLIPNTNTNARIIASSSIVPSSVSLLNSYIFF